MKDTLWLIRKIIFSTFKSYKSWLIYIGLPIAAIALSLMIQSGGAKAPALTIGIVNHDGTQAVTQDVITFIEGLESVVIQEAEEDKINALVTSGELDAALVFPDGFADSLLAGQPETIRIVSIKGATVTGYVKLYLNPYIDNIALIGQSAAGNIDQFASLYADYRAASFQLSHEKVEDRSVNYGIARQTIGYLVIIMLFAAANLSGIMVKEREERTYYRILASPVASKTYVIANILVNLFIMILQIALTLLLMDKVLHIETGIPYPALFFLLVVFAIVAISLSLVIVVYSYSSQAASSLQSVVFLPTCILSGCMIPIDTLPAFLQNIALFLPQYWLLQTFEELQLGNSLGSLYANLLILAAFAAALSLTAAYKVGRNNDVRSYV